MKKAIIAIGLLAVLASCEKKKCYVCTVTVKSTNNAGQPSSTGTSQVTQCDMTSSDKAAFEKAGTTTAYGHSGNVTVTQTTTTTCR